MLQRSVIEQIESRMKEKRYFIQVIAGPWQEFQRMDMAEIF
jgi:hypothetical protein